MNDKLDKWTKKIALISAIFGIIGGGGLYGWFTIIKGPKELIYQGSVQDKDTKEYIVGAEISFPGYTNEIFPCQTDNFGSFNCKLSKEYPNIIIRITHKDYGIVEFNRQLTKVILTNTSDTFHLVPIKQQQTKAQQSTIEIKPTIGQEKILNKNKPNNNEKIEVTGESGYKINSKWAWEEAEKDAYNKLLQRLNKTNAAYEIDNEKSSAYLVDGEGYQAKIVIYTYK